MGFLDSAKDAYEFYQKSSSGDKKETGILGKILNFVGIGSKEGKEAVEVKEKAKTERNGLFSEVFKGLMLRQFPKGSAAWDILGGFGVVNRGPEVYKWQHKVEFITGAIRLIQAFYPPFLSSVTDPLAKSETFQWVVSHWPIMNGIDIPLIGPNGKITERVKAGEPAAVVEAIRIIHQDIVTGKVSYDKLKELLGGGGALAAVGGGTAAAFAGQALLGGGNPLEQVQGILTGGGTGKKIEDLLKEHPEAQLTTMNKNLSSLLKEMGVSGSATLVKGSWINNNDEVTVSYTFNNGKYFLIFDNDVSSTDITVKNDQGMEVANFTDWGGLDAKDDAEKIIAAMKENPSKNPLPSQASPSAQPKTDSSASAPKKAA